MVLIMNLKQYLGSPLGVIVKELDCHLEVNKFKLQS